jgi:DNA-binding SARP family transcriptional activator
VQVDFGVLGPVMAWDEAGDPIALKGPRHRAVLARLLIARGRVVPVNRLVDDLWLDPPEGAVSAVRTFVASLRRAIEPQRPARTPASLLVTEGPGYALRAEPDAVDAWRFEQVVAGTTNLAPEEALARLLTALGWWRGSAYTEFADSSWALAERSRLAELRLRAIEQVADARLLLGLAAEAVPDLDAHVTEHPWREDAWRLLALALYRADRQGDALAVLRRARTLLVEQLGVDPGPGLRRLETDILNQADHLQPRSTAPTAAAGRVWEAAAAAYDRTVAAGARARLESTVGLLRNLAVTGGGGLEAARQHRVAAIAAAEELGDPELTARVIGAYDVPAIWTRSDDEDHAAAIVEAAERTLAVLPADHEAARARLLATIALESRGIQRPEAAKEAEEIARRLDDPALLVFALNGVFMQSFDRAGLAPRRDELGAELIAVAARHGLVTYEVLGHLIRIQARSALANFAAADEHAAAVDRLAERHELPLVGVFTQWYRALRLAATSQASTAQVEAGKVEAGEVEAGEVRAAEVEAAYRAAAVLLDGAGMPGLEHGLLPLALFAPGNVHADEDLDWGPYEPWVRPLALLAQDRRREAAAALRQAPDPPRDLLYEALWCLIARAAIALDDRDTMKRAHQELAPAAAELAGAGSGLLTLGPVSEYLIALETAL